MTPHSGGDSRHLFTMQLELSGQLTGRGHCFRSVFSFRRRAKVSFEQLTLVSTENSRDILLVSSAYVVETLH